MKYIALLSFLFATPVAAWDFIGGSDCLVTHKSEKVDVRLTYSHSDHNYELSLTRLDRAWKSADKFGIRFEGPYPKFISTSRHQLSRERHTLTVSDEGFGNVLDGLAFNNIAIAMVGKDVIALQLFEAKESITQFRICAGSTQI